MSMISKEEKIRKVKDYFKGKDFCNKIKANFTEDKPEQ